MKQIEDEFAQIAGPLLAAGAPDEHIRQARAIFFTGMAVGMAEKTEKPHAM